MTPESLEGVAAFQVVGTQLRNGVTPEAHIAHPCLARLSYALQRRPAGGSDMPSALDLAVLVRQALRFHERQWPGVGSPRVWVPGRNGWPDAQLWTQVGVTARAENEGFLVQAQPWIPGWLPDAGPDGVDAAAAGENQMRATQSVPGDPFLLRFPGHESYRNRGQRTAVRAALCTPPGATLLVCLPTGDGKSFVFQAVSSVGYGAKDGLPGVTLVVTPTVALAMDHQRAATELGIANHRLSYEGGLAAEERLDMVHRIREGTQGLCFASPEAACGILRPALTSAATAGFLRAIVVDEAHLVDAWGANFRASFQVLSGLRAELVRAGPVDAEPRTILLSATLTPATVETLKTLFPGVPNGGAGFQIVSAVQLRPEIDYWVSESVVGEERRNRVVEALLHMPRPAILYVTEVKQAVRWHQELRDVGFRRMGMMTGKSPPNERRQIVQSWRKGELDLVVGTAAFGLGIDNPHVRTVIHACIPETLDRFYQEVGRGGRDGRSSASIIIPSREHGGAPDDHRTAKGLNLRRLLTIDTAYRRWAAMFSRQDRYFEGDNIFRLRVDGPPGFDADYIDMVGESNTEWNVRTLTLMANARLIELLGPESITSNDDPSDDVDAEEVETTTVKLFEQFQRVRVLDTRHLNFAIWQQVVEPRRNLMQAAYSENLVRMFELLERKRCVADTLAPIYHFDGDEEIHPRRGAGVHVALACGGCPDCRMRHWRRETEPAQDAPYPWPVNTHVLAPASELLDNSNRVVIFYGDDLSARILRRWSEGLARLVNCGVRNLIVVPGSPLNAREIADKNQNLAIFTSQDLPPRDYLPLGPVLVIIPQTVAITETLLRPREPSDAHFFFIHRDAEDPVLRDVPLRTRFEGPQLASLDLFIQRMAR